VSTEQGKAFMISSAVFPINKLFKIMEKAYKYFVLLSGRKNKFEDWTKRAILREAGNECTDEITAEFLLTSSTV